MSGRHTTHNGGPDDTSSVTVEPGATNEPAAGLCENTSPAGSAFDEPEIEPGKRSAACSSAVAWATDIPMTFGTVTRDGVGGRAGCVAGTTSDGVLVEPTKLPWRVAATLTRHHEHDRRRDESQRRRDRRNHGCAGVVVTVDATGKRRAPEREREREPARRRRRPRPRSPTPRRRYPRAGRPG